MGKKTKYKVVVIRQVIETLEFEIDACSVEMAEELGLEEALETDYSKWDSDTTDYQIEVEVAKNE